jgi:hypothetical protein
MWEILGFMFSASSGSLIAALFGGVKDAKNNSHM